MSTTLKKVYLLRIFTKLLTLQMMRKESVHIGRKPYKNIHNIHKNVYPSYLNKSTARLVNPDPKLMFGRIPIYLVWLLWRAAAVLNLQYFISRDFVLL